jgi:phage terminase Nu1 subunit (DNA packaging protein)
MAEGINHDTAARLIGVTPGELETLVKAGEIRRVDKNVYALATLVQDYATYLRAVTKREERSPTQVAIAAHLDLSDRSVRELQSRIVLPEDATLTDYRIAYIRHLREMAAGRATDGSIDLSTERARLARAQCEGQEIKNSVALGTWAPIEALTDVLANASQSVVDHLDQIPAGIMRICPDLPVAVRELIMVEVTQARNEMVRKTASLVADKLGQEDMQEDMQGETEC